MTHCKEGGAGRTPLWVGLAREWKNGTVSPPDPADNRGATSADYMQGTRISFRSKEDAMHFAEKQGVYR